MSITAFSNICVVNVINKVKPYSSETDTARHHIGEFAAEVKKPSNKNTVSKKD